MTSDHLTPTESAALVVLMVEAREITNPDLAQLYHITLKRASREKLNGLGMKTENGKTEKGHSCLVHRLDVQDWVSFQKRLNFRLPRASAPGAALEALLDNLRDRVLPLTGFADFGEMFNRNGSIEEPPQESQDEVLNEQVPTADLEERIRAGYAELASEPGAWVILTRLRGLFPDVYKDDLDAALRELSLAEDVNIAPESNQKILTAEDRAAAVRIGRQDKHLLAIGVR